MANKPMSDDIISEMTKKMLSYFRSKDTNKKNAKKRVTKAQKEALSGAGGFTKLQLSRQADAKRKKRLAKQQKNVKGQGQSKTKDSTFGNVGNALTRVRIGAKDQSTRLTRGQGKAIPSKDNLEDRKAALAKKMSKLPKKRPASISALSVIKKDTNIKSDKVPTKKVKATKANTKDYSKTLALQKRLINMGAKIKADGIMGAGTRAAMKKFMNKKTSASPIMSMKTSNIKKVTSRDGSKISIAERLKEIDREKAYKKIIKLAKKKSKGTKS